MNCENCYWFEHCGCETICEYYDRLDLDRLIREEYEQSLRERVLDYQEVIEELN